MKQVLKRSFALLLVLCMCLSVLPMQAFAATAPNTAADYLSQCTKYSTYLILEATSADDDIKTLPCSATTNSASKDVRAMKKGETYTCLAIYKNTAGGYWYEVTATSDYKTGYIYGGTAKFKSFGGNAVLSDVTIATTTPKQGVGCAIKGSITTTSLGKVTINSATGVLKDAQGKSQTKTITSGFGDISKTALNNDLKFGSLSRGPGSLTITTKYSCQDTSGTALTTASGELKQTINFTVQGTYSVVYNANGGTNAPASQTKTYGKSLTLTKSVPTRPGYTFLGWSTNKSATSASYKAGATLSTDVYTGNITLYAVWKSDGDYLSKCTVYPACGTIEVIPNEYGYMKTLPCSASTHSDSKDVRQLTVGEKLTVLAIYKNTEGNFWYKVQNGTSYGYVFGDDVEFVGIPADAITLDVKLATTTPNRGEDCVVSGAVTSASMTLETVSVVLKDSQGATQTQTITSGFGDLSATALNSGLYFENLSRGPGSLTVTAKAKYNFLIGGSTLASTTTEAKRVISFTVQDVYNVVFNGNGGMNEPANQAKTYGKSLVLTTEIPTRIGYTFLGWSTDKNATAADYKAGDTLNKDVYVGDIILYAIWAKDGLEAPKISVGNVASTGKPKISWNKVDGAVKYELYWAASKSGTYTRIGTSTGTSLINKSAKTGKMYYYKVKAVDANGNKSEFSNVVNRTCDIPQPVIKATNIASTGKVKLTWEAVEGAVKYELYRATSKNGTYTKIGTTKNSYITNTSGVAGTLYYYKIRALHGTNSGAHSAFSNIVERSCDLAQPVVTVSLNSAGNPKLTWGTVEGAVKYQVYRATSKDGTYSLIYTTVGTTCTNTKNVEEGRTYYYKVRAICDNSGATSAYSAIKNITVSTALVIK